jgi:hypothetical protein
LFEVRGDLELFEVDVRPSDEGESSNCSEVRVLVATQVRIFGDVTLDVNTEDLKLLVLLGGKWRRGLNENVI